MAPHDDQDAQVTLEDEDPAEALQSKQPVDAKIQHEEDDVVDRGSQVISDRPKAMNRPETEKEWADVMNQIATEENKKSQDYLQQAQEEAAKKPLRPGFLINVKSTRLIGDIPLDQTF